ncbi:MAG: hypothetical protein KDI78_16485 [Xanthomonadales bacterium]|nr:hypothetical protein [Xanthomonadales bacterium]
MKNKLFVTAILFFLPLGFTVAAEVTSDGLKQPFEARPIYNSAPGADEAALSKATTAGFYQFIAGSAFNPRTSTQTVSYPGAGCTFSDANLTTDVQLPDGAVLEGIRFFYYDAGGTGGVTIYMTTYDGLGNYTDIGAVGSTLETGYSSEYLDIDPGHVVDNGSNAYVVIVNTNSGTRFCGARIYYVQ